MAVIVSAAARTDIGRVRRLNQDSFGVDDAACLYVVCDGMGGAAGGEVASRVAVDHFLESFRASLGESSDEDRKDALYHAAMEANDAVLARAEAEPALHGMGSTLVAAHVHGERLLLVNVGDSRAYLLRGEDLSQITEDHSFLDEQVRRGLMTAKAAAASNLQSVITRAIGVEDELQPDLFGVHLEHGDLVLLTSDGLTRHVTDEAIAETLQGLRQGSEAISSEQLGAGIDHLIQQACADGGSDNITCILLHIRYA